MSRITLLCTMIVASTALLWRTPVWAQGDTRVGAALAKMDTWLANGQRERWHAFLRTDELRGELAQPAPRPGVLAKVLERYASRAPGLQSPQIVAVRAALERWLTRVSLPDGKYLPAVAASIRGHAAISVSNGNPRPQGVDLDRLIDGLQAYAVEPSDDLECRIASQLDSLEGTGPAGSLVAGVRDFYQSPDFWLQVSDQTLAENVERKFELPAPVDGFLLGTHVKGSAKIRGTTTIHIVPGVDNGVFNVSIEGTCEATTVGANGPARIYSQSTTPFHAVKQVIMEPSGFRSTPTRCTATTDVRTTGIGSVWPGLRGMLVRRIARRRSAQLEPLSEWMSARQAERQIGQEIDRDVDRQLAALHRDVIKPLLAQATEIAPGACRLKVCSTAGLLRIEVVYGLGRPGAGPNWAVSEPLVAGIPLMAAPAHNQPARTAGRSNTDSGKLSWASLFGRNIAALIDGGTLDISAAKLPIPAWLSNNSSNALSQLGMLKDARVEQGWLLLRWGKAAHLAKAGTESRAR